MTHSSFITVKKRLSFQEFKAQRRKAKEPSIKISFPYLDTLKAVKQCQTQCEEEKTAMRKRRKKGNHSGLLWLAAGLGLGFWINNNNSAQQRPPRPLGPSRPKNIDMLQFSFLNSTFVFDRGRSFRVVAFFVLSAPRKE